MAYVPMTAGGGSMSETTLWENNAPTTAYVATTVNLSGNISDYEYIGFECRESVNNDNRLTYYIKASDFPDCVAETNEPMPCLFTYQSTYYYCRLIQYDSDTTVAFARCYRGKPTGTWAGENSALIPLRVVGLK